MARAAILLVEDENIVALNIKNRLTTMEFNVIGVVSSGEEAILKAEEMRPDLVLMDIKLKGKMDGIEAAKQIGSRFDIPVIYLTAFSDNAMLDRAKKSEPFGYILKPIDDKELFVNIEMALYKHKMELKLKHERNLIRTVVESLPDSISVKDTEHRFLLLNKACARMLGESSADDIIGKTGFDFIPKKQATKSQKDEQTVLETGRALTDKEQSVTARDGTTRWSLSTKVPLKDSKERIVGIVSVERDITERKRAEHLLNSLNEAALAIERAMTPSEIFAKVAEVFKKIDLQCMIFLSDEQQEILSLEYMSHDASIVRAAEKLTGLKTSELKLGIETVEVYQRVVCDKQTVFVKNVEPIVRNLLPKSIEKLAGRLINRIKMHRFISAPLIVDNNVVGVLSVQSTGLVAGDVPAITAFANQMAASWFKAKLMQDLEESLRQLRRTQDQLLQSQKMEAVGRLAGGIAHDFNNLLTAIMGYTELILIDEEISESIRADLTEVKLASERAASLTRQLLAFSRRQPFQPKLLDLNIIIANMNKMLRRMIGEDVRLNTFLGSEMGLVKADPGQLEQVVLNLVVNARDAMRSGGLMTIRTEHVTVDSEYCRAISYARPGDFICVSIEDTGEGMDKTTVSQIFEPFFSTKSKTESSGLGLAVVYGIVKQHDGWINVYSDLGEGSIFKLYLPAYPLVPLNQLDDKGAHEELVGKNQRILLVEDEETIREFARRVLGENGYLVFESTTAREALDIFEKNNGEFDLLFSDVVLPDVSGVHLAEQLLNKNSKLKILLGSGYANHKSQWPLIRDRGFQFLQKPYVLMDLLQAVSDALNHK